MRSNKVAPGTPATYQQYNYLRDDARSSSYLLPHEANTPNMTVLVEGGYFYTNTGTRIDYAGGTATIGAVGANPRYDLLSINSSGTLVTTVGTASGSPVKPALPANSIGVCYIYLRVGGTSIKTDDDTTNHYIIDSRGAFVMLVTSSDSITEGSTNLYFTDVRALLAAPAETLSTTGALIATATDKTTPVDADYFGLMNSASSNILAKLSWANVKATIKTYYDAVTSTLTNKSISLGSNTVTGTIAQFNSACTDADFVTGGGTATGANTADETLATIGTKMFSASNKATPVDADSFSIFDSASTNALKTLSFTNLKAFLVTYFNTLYVTATGALTLTNKRMNPRLAQATTYTTSVTMDFDLYDEYDITAQAGALLFSNPSGTAVNGQKRMIRIKDNGTAQNLTYGTQIVNGAGTLPTATVAGKKNWIGLEWDSTDSKYYCIAVGSQP